MQIWPPKTGTKTEYIASSNMLTSAKAIMEEAILPTYIIHYDMPTLHYYLIQTLI